MIIVTILIRGRVRRDIHTRFQTKTTENYLFPCEVKQLKTIDNWQAQHNRMENCTIDS